MKVVHIPFSGRNPYQKLLADGLKACGVVVKGEPVQHLRDISFLNLSLFTLLFKHWKPDIVHLHWQSSFLHVEGSRFKTILKSLLFLFQLWMLKKLGIKLVWTVHNLKRHEETYRDLEAHFTGKLAGMSDGIIVHCQTAKDDVLHLFDTVKTNKISVIAHGHFLGYYPNDRTREAACKKLDLKPSKLTFLFLGELRYYKGVIELIEAFRSIDNEDLQLLIAGQPHGKRIRDDVREKAANVNNITTHYTYVPDQELQNYINASDIMVFPYRNIFTSGGIFMALSFGIPIIAPRLGCITDALHESPNFIYDATEGGGLVNAMRAAIEFKDRLDDIGRYNRNLANRFGWQEIAEKTTDTYRKCLKK